MNPEERQSLRLKRLNRRGQGVANDLADLLAGKDIRLGDIPISGVVGMSRREQRLRAFLDMINEARRIITGEGYLKKLAEESLSRQLYLDDNPWMEAEAERVTGRETDGSE